MQNKIRVGLALVATLLFSTCDNNENPKPPGKITFTWTPMVITNVDYYAVVSDTTGTILDWKKLPNGEKVELTYVPDGEQGTVSLIRHVTFDGNGHSTDIATFTDVAAGDYSYTEDVSVDDIGPGRHEIVIENFEDYDSYSVLTKAPAINSEFENETGVKFTVPLVEGAKEDLFVSLESEIPNQFHYLYKDEIKDGERTTITLDDYDDLPLIPGKSVSYPDIKDMKFGSGMYIAYRDERNSALIATNYWSPGDTDLQIGFVDFPDLFTSFEAIVYGFTPDGKAFYINDVISDEPETEFSALKADLTINDFKTERLSVDATGAGATIYAHCNINTPTAYVQWDVYSPRRDHNRINTPKFTDDIIAEITPLGETKNKTFQLVTIADYGMTYEQFYKFRLSSNFYVKPQNTKAKEYINVDGSSGRMTFDAKSILKELNRPFENPLLKKKKN